MSQTGAQASSTPPKSVQGMPPAAASVEKSTLAQQAHARIKEDIFEFRMAPGQRYSEQELANRLGVSRTPLRFALHVLAREGYLVRLDGHACWQVKPFELSYYDDLYDFRTQLELIAVRRLCALDPAPDLGASASSGASTSSPPSASAPPSRSTPESCAPCWRAARNEPRSWCRPTSMPRVSRSGVKLPAGYDPATAYTDKFIAEINKFDRNAVEVQAKNWKE